LYSFDFPVKKSYFEMDSVGQKNEMQDISNIPQHVCWVKSVEEAAEDRIVQTTGWRWQQYIGKGIGERRKIDGSMEVWVFRNGITSPAMGLAN